MAPTTVTTVRPARSIRGRVRLAGDKSISHRYAMLAALATGRSTIRRYAPGADCAATLSCLRSLGAEITTVDGDAERDGPVVQITGRGLRGLVAPGAPIDAQNSGTTMRVLAGVLAAHAFDVTLVGDASLARRPMQRVIEPLERMGARIESRGGYPPLTVHGARLRGVDHRLPVPSAQVKTALLVAGLQAEGRTRIWEPAATRDHTEIALRAFGADAQSGGHGVELEGGQRLHGLDLVVPGDISSGAFWAVAAAALPDSDIELEDVGLNPTRTALLQVLQSAGARVEVTGERQEAGESRGRVRIRHGAPGMLVLGAAEVPALIDELPALAAWATLGGRLRVTGAAELRVKESDRISALARGLRALGAAIDELPDGFEIDGAARLRGGHADAVGDHRLAMAFAIAALGATAPSTIAGADSVAVSYPGFFETLESLCR